MEATQGRDSPESKPNGDTKHLGSIKAVDLEGHEHEFSINVEAQEKKDFVKLNSDKLSLTIELDEDTRVAFKRLGAHARVKKRTVEQQKKVMGELSDVNLHAREYYYGTPTLKVQMPPKNFEIVAELSKFIRKRELAFVYGVPCPKCGKAVFKGECECGEPVEGIDTVCPYCGPEVTVTFSSSKHGICPKCHNNVNIQRYLNIGGYNYLKPPLSKALKTNRPFHFFTGLVHLLHSKDGKQVDLRKERYIYGFDLALDIDEDTINKAKKEALKAKTFLDSIGAPHLINFSGSKGFHIWVLYETLESHFGVEKKTDFYTPDDVTDILKDVGNKIKDGSGANIDTVALSGQRQLIRVPYSYHFKTENICLPAIDLKKFKVEDAHYTKILQTPIRDKLKEVGFA
jgi:hypothetical protein